MDDLAAEEVFRHRSKRRNRTIQRCSKRRINDSSISCIDNLPECLLLEILVRVADSRSAVCKHWFSLVSDPHFVHRSIHRHHHQCVQPDGNWLNLLVQYSEQEISGYWRHLQPIPLVPNLKSSNSNQHHILKFLPCFREEDRDPIFVAAYFNDLLLCCESALYQKVYYICNPLTKQWVMLPPVQKIHPEMPVGFVCYPASCGDNKQSCLTNARYIYKVVRIIMSTANTTYKFNAEIFHSQSGEWKIWEVSSPKPFCILWRITAIVTCNGILHWINQYPLYIVAYDPLNNVVSLIRQLMSSMM